MGESVSEDELLAAWASFKFATFVWVVDGDVPMWVWASPTTCDLTIVAGLALGTPGFRLAMRDSGLLLHVRGEGFLVPYQCLTPASVMLMHSLTLSQQASALQKASKLVERRFPGEPDWASELRVAQH